MKSFLNILLSLIAALAMAVSSYAQNPGSVEENMVMSAVSMLEAGDVKGAKDKLYKVIADYPSNDAAWFYLAKAMMASRKEDLVEGCLKKAVELDSTNFWYRQTLADYYAMTSRPELTIAMYEKLLEDFPKKSDLYLNLVELYASQGENDKALKTLDDVETVFGVTESVAVFRYNLLRRMERHEDALKSLEEYNKQYSSPYVLSTLADFQMAMYNDSTALAYYNEALDIDPEYSPALLGKAETLRLTRRYSEYFPVLMELAGMRSMMPQGKSSYLLAVVQHTDPKFIRSFMPQLDSVVNTAVAVHPGDTTILNMAGVYYYTTQRNDPAKQMFRTAAEMNPSSLNAAADYVEFLMYAGEYETLSEEGRKAFERFPYETAFLEMASVGDFNLERYDKVLEICDMVLEKAPADSSKTLRAWSTKGDIYARLGDRKKAYRAYEKALKINPDYVYVLNNYAYHLSEDGKNLKKANAMSLKTIKAEPDNATYLDTYAWILYLQGKAADAKPFFKHAMLYGGKDSAVIMDHYAEVLYALKEYDLAFVYWNLAKQKNDGAIPDLDEKIKQRKVAIGR